MIERKESNSVLTPMVLTKGPLCFTRPAQNRSDTVVINDGQSIRRGNFRDVQLFTPFTEKIIINSVIFAMMATKMSALSL